MRMMSLSTFFVRLSKVKFLMSKFNYMKLFIKFRVVPSVEHRNALKNLSIGMVVDVGSNRGQFATLSRLLWPTSKLILIEPIPECVSKLKILFKSSSDVTILESAVGVTSSERDFYILKSSDSSSLYNVKNFSQSRHLAVKSKILVKVETLDVLLAPYLDEMIATPTLLKIDVQGGELDVLKGGNAIFSTFEYILIEVSFRELYEGQALVTQIVAVMIESGYQIEHLYNCDYDSSGLTVQADILFRRCVNHISESSETNRVHN
jgi:FkbM family methyltransferase